MIEVEDDKMDVEHPLYEKAVAIASVNPGGAITLLKELLSIDTDDLRIKEMALYKLAELYAQLRSHDDIRMLLVESRPYFSTIPKARTAKIVRSLIDIVGEIPDSLHFQIQLCRESIEWCVEQKRTFLKQRIEAKLAGLLLLQKEFRPALDLISELIREVKKIDDKLLLVEIYLVESKIHLALRNIPKAKASLTSGKAASNAIYCPPTLQALIDEQAGILCAEEKDYKTSFSYFYEAFESYNTVGVAVEAVRMLKYMLLTKVMMNQSQDVFGIISGKAGIKYAGVELRAMKAVAEAYRKRSLEQLQQALQEYKEHLLEDPIISSQLTGLCNNLLEQNLLRLIEPFSKVEISHIAELIGLPLRDVQFKLSEMILDKKFHGILDQGAGNLIVYDSVGEDVCFGFFINF